MSTNIQTSDDSQIIPLDKPETYRVKISIAKEIADGDFRQAQTTLEALAKTGGSLSLHLVTEALETRGYLREEQFLAQVPFNLNNDKLGEIAHSNQASFAWQVSQIDQADRMLSSGNIANPSGNELVKVGSELAQVLEEPEKIVNMAVVIKQGSLGKKLIEQVLS